MNYALIFALFFIPLGFLQYGVIHNGHHLAFALMATLVIGWQIKNRIISLFVSYLVLWQAFVLIYSMFHRVPRIVVLSATETVLYVTFGLFIYHAVTESKIKKETIYNVICIAACFQLTIALTQFFLHYDPVVHFLKFAFAGRAIGLLGENTVTGTLGNNNFLAAYLAISLPFFFRKTGHFSFMGRDIPFGWFYAVPVILFILYKSSTTSAVVPAIIASAWFFKDKLTKRELYLAIGGAALVIIAYACFQHTPFYENPRWKDWMSAIQQVSISPWTLIFGMGPGAGWGKGYPMHNEWLQFFHQYGIIGAALMGAFAYRIFRVDLFIIQNKILFASMLVIVINMFGNYSLHLAPSAFLIILIAGLIERERGKIND